MDIHEPRHCTRCGIFKPAEEFSLRKRDQRRQSWCRACVREYSRDRYKNNPEARAKYKATSERWNKAHPEKRAAAKRRQQARLKATDPDKYRRQRRSYDFQQRYGIRLVDYEAMVAAQQGVCAICGCPPTNGRMLQIDHCHETGDIRALLCGNCNLALGLMGDNPDRLVAAVGYLRRYVPKTAKG